MVRNDNSTVCGRANEQANIKTISCVNQEEYKILAVVFTKLRWFDFT